jgi:hypothetical protein
MTDRAHDRGTNGGSSRSSNHISLASQRGPPAGEGGGGGGERKGKRHKKENRISLCAYVREHFLTDGRNGGDDLPKLQLVQNSGLTSGVETYHENAHLLLGEEPLKQLGESKPHRSSWLGRKSHAILSLFLPFPQLNKKPQKVPSCQKNERNNGSCAQRTHEETHSAKATRNKRAAKRSALVCSERTRGR